MKLIKNLVLLKLSLFSLGAFAQPEPPLGKKWEIIENMSDEFNGTSLDINKWADQNDWKGRPPGYFLTDNVKVRDGSLQLIASKLANPFPVANAAADAKFKTWTHGGAIVSSKNSNTFGYYESKIKANKTFMSTTFWLLNDRREFTGCDKREIELDILESIGVNNTGQNWGKNFIYTMSTNTHSRKTSCDSTPVGGVGKHIDLPGEVTVFDKFHTYGVWWKSSKEILFYLDGKLVFEAVPKADFNLASYLRFVVETYSWNPPIDDQIDGLTQPEADRTSYYDYIRSYKLIDCTENCENKGFCNTNAELKNLKISDSTKTTLTLSFTELYDNQVYEFRVFPVGEFNGDINTGTIKYKAATSSPVIIDGLEEGVNYTIVARAICSDKKSSLLTQIDGKTAGTFKPPCESTTVIDKLQLTTVTDNSITLSFEELKGNNNYELRVFASGSFNGNINGGALEYKGGLSSPITVNNLDAGTNYTLVLRAICQAGQATKISEIEAKTTGVKIEPCNPNEKMAGLVATQNAPSSVAVSFNELSNIDKYELRVYASGSYAGGNINIGVLDYKSGTSSPIIMDGLEPATPYTFVIRAICASGEVTLASQVEFVPTSAKTINETFNSFKVTSLINPSRIKIDAPQYSSNNVVSITIFNLSGKMILSKKHSLSDAETLIQFPNLAKGLYLVKISYESKVVTNKLIVD